MYSLNESEVRTISSFNTAATICFSLASVMVTLGISIYINAVFYTTLTPEGQLAKQFVAPIIIGLGVVVFAMGCVAMVLRSGFWRNIKRESN
jgi:hypothetical protein